jgi:hypothetical protein
MQAVCWEADNKAVAGRIAAPVRHDLNELRVPSVAGFLPCLRTMPPEIVIGRWLAICAHPICASRVLSPLGRLLLAGTYFGLCYVAVLAALLLL